MSQTLGWPHGNLLETAFPHRDIRTRAVLVFSGSLLMALASRLTLFLPFTPVPVTGQTFAVLLLASVLGFRLALSAQLLYLAEGLSGLPVFAAGPSWGVARLLGPTGGFLVGFVAATAVIGWMVDRGWGGKFGSALLVMGCGEAAMYCVALPWLSIFTHANWTQTLHWGLYPFVLGDLYKMVLVAMILPLGWNLLRRPQ